MLYDPLLYVFVEGVGLSQTKARDVPSLPSKKKKGLENNDRPGGCFLCNFVEGSDSV